MDLSTLKPSTGSVRNNKRVGRGPGSGKGGTSTRGHKGAKSRSGYKSKRGFEGGQMPLQRRVPKFGFTNLNRVEYKAINISVLDKLAQEAGVTQISPETIIAAGLAGRKDRIKILANGDISTKLDVKAHAFSKAAEAAIVEKGGSIEKI